MKIAIDVLSRIFARALDIIEEEQIGASQYHDARVASLCAAMSKQLGYDDDTLSALVAGALFHDNALTEFHLSEKMLAQCGENVALHCKKGQENVGWLPFKSDAGSFILYHHEREDGSGPFHKRDGEYPFEAALLAAADAVDVTYRLQTVSPKDLPSLRDKIAARAGEFSTRRAVGVLLDILDEKTLESLRDENVNNTLAVAMPRWEVSVTADVVMGISDFIAHVIDFKSKFTRKHTDQIANRVWLMGTCYGYGREELAALYLAASLHDIGKTATPVAVLEKPGKLDPDEFNIIKKHVKDTHDWLADMPDFDLIRNWAADHHEKLDGTGYSFGKSADELDFNSRLMACIDIYQAVCEERPYHEARSHGDTMPILRSMADKGFIDPVITADIDEIMEEYSFKDVPYPKL